MKIGILTHPLRFNYGGLLQNYALQLVLKRLGHEPVTLDPPYHHRFLKKTIVVDLLRRIYHRYFLGIDEYIFPELRYNRNFKIMMSNLTPFIENYIDKLEVNNYYKLSPDRFDALIVGSDQVWRRAYNETIYNQFFDFAENWKIKRISYAASFGTDDWEYSDAETLRCKQLIGKFDAISVREKSGVSLCNKYFGVSAKHVLDPTMLLTKEDYTLLFKNIKNPHTADCRLFTYFLDEKKDNQLLISKMAELLRTKDFCVNSKYNSPGFHSVDECIQPSIQTWLQGFNHADFILTDSFHACVFSIIFNKPFYVITNKARGISRLQSLLSMFSLDDRILVNTDLPATLEPINWELVNQKLEIYRKYSMDFLKEALEK